MANIRTLLICIVNVMLAMLVVTGAGHASTGDCWTVRNTTSRDAVVLAEWKPYVPNNGVVRVALNPGGHYSFCGRAAQATLKIGSLGHAFQNGRWIYVAHSPGDPPGEYLIVNAKKPVAKKLGADCPVQPANKCALLVLREIYVNDTNDNFLNGNTDEIRIRFCRTTPSGDQKCNWVGPHLKKMGKGRHWKGNANLGVFGQFDCPNRFQLIEIDTESNLTKRDSIGRWEWDRKNGKLTSGSWVPNYIHKPRPTDPKNWTWLVLEDSGAHYDVFLEIIHQQCPG